MKITFGQGIAFREKHKISSLFSSALKVLGQSNSLLTCEINFATSGEIHELNKKFRGVDKETDVLSFPNLSIHGGKLISDAEFSTDVDLSTRKISLGSIVICRAVAEKQAIEFGHSLTREISFLALHGLLHLLGFDHMEEDDEFLMNALQEKILTKNNILRVKK